jgi:AraC-like DNA-binding protein
MIKKFTGQNYSGIIKTIRLQKATNLLLESSKTISEIVEEVGYTDDSHFYKIFKQNYGMTPTQYKEQQKRDNTR